MMIPINEIFQTIQGEAHYTGTPSIFIRTQGCDVGCPWCDTKHTWVADKKMEIPWSVMMQKDLDSSSYAMMDPNTIGDVISEMPEQHVVITGGEPCDHDLTELTHDLIEDGRTVQIETSGTSQIRCTHRTWVTLSPKIDMPGGRRVRGDAISRADEIKMPVGKPADVERLKEFLEKNNVIGRPIWLQPLSQSKKATEVCIEAARQNHWRVSLQTHKFLGLR